jgi:hypothetical protein
MTHLLRLIMLISLLLATVAQAQEPSAGSLTGRLQTSKGAPLKDAIVFLFNDQSGPPPAPERYWRVPDEIVTSDQEGRFIALVPPGRYFIGAIKRQGDKEVGPPRPGDLFLTSIDDKGNPKSYQVGRGEQTDVGILAGAAPYKAETGALREGSTAIEGTVVGGEGQPVRGASVLAFLSPAMVGKPVFVSERTGSDGRFVLRVWGSGTFYLKARDVYGGGPPKVGGMIGGYGDESPLPVVVKAGTITKGITVKVGRFAGQGPATR